MDLLKPSLNEAAVIQEQDAALDLIGKRGLMTPNVPKAKRIQMAKGILQKEMLPLLSATATFRPQPRLQARR